MSFVKGETFRRRWGFLRRQGGGWGAISRLAEMVEAEELKTFVRVQPRFNVVASGGQRFFACSSKQGGERERLYSSAQVSIPLPKSLNDGPPSSILLPRQKI